MIKNSIINSNSKYPVYAKIKNFKIRIMPALIFATFIL